MNGRIDFFASNEQLAASDASGILNRIDNLLTSYNDASFGNVDISGRLNLINLENDNQNIMSQVNYYTPPNNYDYGLVRYNITNHQISYSKYFPGQIIFFSDYCRPTTNDSHTLVKIYTKGNLYEPISSYGSSASGYKSNESTSVIWVGDEFIDPSNEEIENTDEKYVTHLVIPTGCPKNLEISVGGWKCGTGTGDATLLVIRNNGSSDYCVYNRDYSSPIANCSINTITFFWNDFQPNDRIKLFARSNSDGSNDTRGVYPAVARTYTTNNFAPNPAYTISPNVGQVKIRAC